MRFKNGSHMYLIEQLQINGDTTMPTYHSYLLRTDERNIDLGHLNFQLNTLHFLFKKK